MNTEFVLLTREYSQLMQVTSVRGSAFTLSQRGLPISPSSQCLAHLVTPTGIMLANPSFRSFLNGVFVKKIDQATDSNLTQLISVFRAHAGVATADSDGT